MSNVTTKEITALAVSDKGVMVGENQWLNFSKYGGPSRGDFTKGGRYTIEVKAGKNGGEFVQKVINGVSARVDVQPDAKSAQTENHSLHVETKSWSDNEASKNMRILVQNAYGSALVSPALQALVLKEEDLISTVSRVAEAYIAKVLELHGEYWK